jgi:hypothetical protein
MSADVPWATVHTALGSLKWVLLATALVGKAMC